MSVVDCHMLFGSGLGWWDVEHGGGSREGPAEKPAPLQYDVARILDQCGRAGINRACLLPLVNESYATANRAVADVCAKHPDRFIGFAAHSPEREEGRIRSLLTSEVRSMGLRAVRSDGHPTRELLDAVRELGIPLIYSPTVAPPVGPARMFYMLTENYPDVNFILPHMNRYCPDYIAAMEVVDYARLRPNFHFDTSATMYLKYLERATQTVPIEQILFGSCAPNLDAVVAVETIRLLELPPEQHAKVMGGNILRLLKLTA
jgi:predicted TIM-barrel fold metal-dependent hydrolase